MIPSIRQEFNQRFSEETYNAYLHDLASVYPGQLDFRVAETPVFVPKAFTQKMLDACEIILDQISTKEYKRISNRAIPANVNVPGLDEHPHCIAFDFGVCENENGELEPQLIEM